LQLPSMKAYNSGKIKEDQKTKQNKKKQTKKKIQPKENKTK